ncbi:hypothetical protein T12_15685 [Trichinella patagoniensis]|uniref:Uncharacterized protein n=1 Tax=Trichinella patagoniensis TaxID=990121 RepID=A0A0V0Z3M2_9BILA|nr:hypothetical protein T12_15685 [Trichinella patagoniensis]
MRRRVLTKSFLNFQIEQCISLVHIVSRHRLEFVFSKMFHCTKTGFQRCAMQITITIKGALSSVRAHLKEKAKTRVTRRADRVRHQADHGRHETDRGRHEAEQEKAKGICGSPWVPIL